MFSANMGGAKIEWETNDRICNMFQNTFTLARARLVPPAK